MKMKIPVAVWVFNSASDRRHFNNGRVLGHAETYQQFAALVRTAPPQSFLAFSAGDKKIHRSEVREHFDLPPFPSGRVDEPLF